MDKFKERESNESSHLVTYDEYCVLRKFHTTLSYSSPLILQYVRTMVFYVSSDFLKQRIILARIASNLRLVSCLSFVAFSSHVFSFVNSISAVNFPTMAKNNNNNDKTNDNKDNSNKTVPDYKTLTKTNDEDNKKRMQRKKRFAKPALLDTPANANIGGLFEEDSARLPNSSAIPSSSGADPISTEEPMEQDGDDDIGVGGLFDRDAPIDDSVLESDADSPKVAAKSPPPPPPPPQQRTLRQYVTPGEEEVVYGVRYEWAPSKNAWGETPQTRRDIGCQAQLGGATLVRRRQILKRHRDKKRARTEPSKESGQPSTSKAADTRKNPPKASKIQNSDTSSSGRKEAVGGQKKKEGDATVSRLQEKEAPSSRSPPRPPRAKGEDLRRILDRRHQECARPSKRARYESPPRRQSDQQAEKARRFFKTRNAEKRHGRQRQEQRQKDRKRQRSRRSSPQAGPSRRSADPPSRSFMESMRDELMQAINMGFEARDREDRRRSPSPFGAGGPKNKGKGKGKGKGRRD